MWSSLTTHERLVACGIDWSLLTQACIAVKVPNFTQNLCPNHSVPEQSLHNVKSVVLIENFISTTSTRGQLPPSLQSTNLLRP